MCVCPSLCQAVHIHQSSRPSAWLTCTRNSARLVDENLLMFDRGSEQDSLVARWLAQIVTILVEVQLDFLNYFAYVEVKNTADDGGPEHDGSDMIVNSFETSHGVGEGFCGLLIG